MSNLGTISTISELIEKSYDQMINDNRWFAFAFVLLSVIAVFGYGGYLFLVIRQRQSYFSIFFILGITRAKIILINLSVGLILLVLAFAAALYVTPWFMHNLLGISQSTPGLLSILYSCGVLLIVLLVSTIIGFRQAIKSTEFALYQGGD
jgi:cobalamin synthase